MISAVVLTKNEEKNIKNCLKKLMWCNEVLVIDDFSSDSTIKIAKSFKKTKIYKRNLNNDFSSQRNFGLSKAQNEWVLFIDADEEVSTPLSEEILLKTRDKNKDAFYIKRRDLFLGKELKHGETGKIKLVRLARKKTGKWKRKVHEYWDIRGQIEELDNPLVHKKDSVRDFLDKINYYSDLHSKEILKEGKSANFLKVVIWPVGKFFENYFIKLGILDGREGFIMSAMMSFHSFLGWSKAWIS